MKKELKDYLHLYLGCECVVDMRKYLSGTGKVYDLKKVPALFDSINRSESQSFGVTFIHKSGLEYFDVFDKLCRVYTHFVHPVDINPILRPLSDMTEEEVEYTLRLNYRYEVIEIWRSSERFISYRFLYTYGKKPRRSPEKSDFFPVQPKTPEAFKYHLSKHFDLFGLIDAGLAIDKTTLK